VSSFPSSVGLTRRITQPTSPLFPWLSARIRSDISLVHRELELRLKARSFAPFEPTLLLLRGYPLYSFSPFFCFPPRAICFQDTFCSKLFREFHRIPQVFSFVPSSDQLVVELSQPIIHVAHPCSSPLATEPFEALDVLP